MGQEEIKAMTALITGASSGIGRELCKFFAKDGYNLVLVARDEARMIKLGEELVGRFAVSPKIVAKDLALPDATQEIYEQLKSENIEVNYLVNNAGFGQWGRFHEIDPQTLYDMVAVNMTSLTKLTRLYLPDMVKRGYGGILNVASSAGFVPGPNSAVYYATKAYVIHLTEAISAELKGTDVTATVLCPGPVKTQFFKRSEAAGTRLEEMFPQEAEKVAEIGYKALMRGQGNVIPSWFYKVLVFSTRLMPRKLVTKVSHWQLSRKQKPVAKPPEKK
jgi:short-subunit dehydrogenase